MLNAGTMTELPVTEVKAASFTTARLCAKFSVNMENAKTRIIVSKDTL